MAKRLLNIAGLTLVLCILIFGKSKATDITNNSFLISDINGRNYYNTRIWEFLEQTSSTGIEFELDTLNRSAFLKGTEIHFSEILQNIGAVIQKDISKVFPVFINYQGDILLLDSIIQNSGIANQLFYLPQGETWPSLEYLVQSNRRIILFVEGEFKNESRVLHKLENYALEISASNLLPGSVSLGNTSNVNYELFKVDNFENLPTAVTVNRNRRNQIPDYVNYLLEIWKKFGKKPNFIFVGSELLSFDFILDQLNSFTWINGQVRTTGKNLEKVYWKNPDVLVSGGKFSFPYRGGEEVILSPFAPGYKMTPEQIIVTGEMVIPENYSILATPLNLSEGIKGSFSFDGIILNSAEPEQSFEGTNFSFSEDIERGSVLRLPENASINLGDPNNFGLPNSSFTVSCFAKFTDILEFGDNAVLGNYETGYRRGMHLILRSGHPYFGLYSNDFMSEEILENNVWYHLAWRYIIETGEQAIFLNGKYIGGSDGHPPYSGTSDIHVGSALSQGASLRGYIDNLNIWNRPLGIEEINRLSLDEEIHIEDMIPESEPLPVWLKMLGLFILLVLVLFTVLFLLRIKMSKKAKEEANILVHSPVNKIQLFGEFKAVNKTGSKITDLFTPKVKELFLYVAIYTLKNGIGAQIQDLNESLWGGLSAKKIANNRSVTLNKLRKILIQFDKVEIVSNNGHLQLVFSEPFFCDYIQAFQLCQIPQGMTRFQLESFFELVKTGRFLKGVNWNWTDEIRGFIGNQVIDNLIKLASIYKKENKLKEIEAIAQRILDYDDLNEEAIFFQIWALEKANNTHLAKFNFNSFCTKYEKSFGEPYSMNFLQFNRFYSEQL